MHTYYALDKGVAGVTVATTDENSTIEIVSARTLLPGVRLRGRAPSPAWAGDLQQGRN